VLSSGFGDVGSPVNPLFPLYFGHRDRVVRLGREFAIAVANFADADHLRIEEIGPASATRRPSRLRAGAEIVTMPLVSSEGVCRRMLKVQFSYFSGSHRLAADHRVRAPAGPRNWPVCSCSRAT